MQSTPASSGSVALATIYGSHDRAGVICIITAGCLSLSAVVTLLITRTAARERGLSGDLYKRTHLLGYGLCLLISNMIQSVGTIMSVRWVQQGAVSSGKFCRAQGGIKQAGNVATAFWAFMISLHVFNLLFLRYISSRRVFVATVVGTWTFLVFLIILGPTAIGKPTIGPYFDVSGDWCWISPSYPKAQAYMEYMLEYLSAGLSFIIYVLTLLRIRGNLICVDNKWQLQMVPRGMSWQLSFGRDVLDTSMLRLAQNVVWYPVAYSVMLIPAGCARLYQFSGRDVPLWATMLTVAIYNLSGLVNVLLFLSTRRLLPVTRIPDFTTPRQDKRLSVAAGLSVTPFTMLAVLDISAHNTDSHLATVSPMAQAHIASSDRVRHWVPRDITDDCPSYTYSGTHDTSYRSR